MFRKSADGDIYKLKPYFEENEETPHMENDYYLEAARRLAFVLAYHGERGFEHIMAARQEQPHRIWTSAHSVQDLDNDVEVEAMFRIFLIADSARVPKKACKAASWAGGVSVGDGLTSFKECPQCGDAGHKDYAKLCDYFKLLMINKREIVRPDINVS